MIHRHLSRRIQFITLAIGLILSFSTSVLGQTASHPLRIHFIPPPPPDIGQPSRRDRGAGSRGPSCQRYQHVTALVPSATPQSLPWGLTTAAHPTLWFYAPQGLAENVSLEWVLQDETGQNRYRKVVQTSETPAGVFSLSLPATANPLQEGKTYQWSIFIYCDPEAADLPIAVKGSLHRIALTSGLQHQLENTQDALEQASLYAENGIWYDALTTLGERLRQGGTAEMTSAWIDLLNQANLSGLESEKVIVPCCVIPDL